MEKVINKVPFLCRLGFHRWRCALWEPVYRQQVYLCQRCGLSKTVVLS
jgi:hypothetical protein